MIWNREGKFNENAFHVIKTMKMSVKRLIYNDASLFYFLLSQIRIINDLGRNILAWLYILIQSTIKYFTKNVCGLYKASVLAILFAKIIFCIYFTQFNF